MKIKDGFLKGKLGSRQLVLSGLILFIAIAGYINLNYAQPAEKNDVATKEVDSVPAAATPKNDEFAEMKINRDKSKSESMAVFREIIENEKSSSDAVQKAQADMSASAKTAETEKMIESLLSAKGFENAIVYISADKVNVIVKSDGLLQTEITKIRDIVIENTDFGADSIKVVEKA